MVYGIISCYHSRHEPIPSQKGLAEILNLSQQAVSKHIKKLEQANLIKIHRYSESMRITENPKGKFLIYELPNWNYLSQVSQPPQPSKPEPKFYQCQICKAKVKSIVTHFQRKHEDKHRFLQDKIREMQKLTGERNNEISRKFFRLVAVVVPERVYHEICSEYKDAMSSETKYHPGKLFVSITKELCMKNNVVL